MKFKICFAVILIMVYLKGLNGKNTKRTIEEEIQAILDSAWERINVLIKQQAAVEASANEAVGKVSRHIGGTLGEIMPSGAAVVSALAQSLSNRISGAVNQGQVSQECADQLRAEMSDMATNRTNTVYTCSNMMSQPWEQMSGEVNQLLSASSSIIASASKKFDECVRGSPTEEDLPSIAACVQNEKDAIVNGAETLFFQLDDTLIRGSINIDQALFDILGCSIAAQWVAREQAKSIEQKLSDCMA